MNDAVILKKGRSAALDALKLCACFAVIVIHVSGWGIASLPVHTDGWLASTFRECLARFAVPLFLMCTGAVMLSPPKGAPDQTIRKKYFWKILRILSFWGWMYILFNIAGKALAGTKPEPRWFWHSIRDVLLVPRSDAPLLPPDSASDLRLSATVVTSLRTGHYTENFRDGITHGPAAMAAGIFGLARIRLAEKPSSPQMAKLVNASFCIYLIHFFHPYFQPLRL